MKLFNKIYLLCPGFLQNIAISLYGLLLYCRRYGKIYNKYLNIYHHKDDSSLTYEKKMQNLYFLKLLHYAITYSPFYKEFYKDIDISHIKSVEDITLLPILTKDNLGANLYKVYTIPQKRSQKFYTGGTTGSPMMVLKRKVDVQKRMAYLDAYKLDYGFINNKMRSARFFGKNIIPKTPKNHVFWRDNYISKHRYYSTYYLQQENLEYYVTNLNAYKPEAIEGFVSAIYTVAEYIYQHNISLKFTPRAVFTTAETVLPMHRKIIEKVFHCPLSDQYASNEGAPFIKQCILGSYHEAIDTGVFEHITTSDGTKLIVTSFDSFGTPLIRYDIGDNVIPLEKITCSCGSVHPVIGGIEGRSTEFLLSKTRGKISLAGLSVLVSELPYYYKQIQFIQNSKDSITIKVVIGKELYREEMNQLLTYKMRRYLGEDMAFYIERTNNIARTKSGKYQMIVNNIVNLNKDKIY